MSTGYKGIIIPDKIIIVENKDGQGFVVPYGNDKVLQTALNWASSIIYPGEGTWEERRDKAIEFEGIQNIYDNGHFKMKLNQSAGHSYNGGKLSFWNCDIIAPDGKTYLIGINQELLCNLLSNCTLIKGEVQEELYLGKQQGNTGLYTEDMDDFKQAQLEIQQKKDMKSKTKKYNVGDLVGTLTKNYIYLGEFIKSRSFNLHYDYEKGTPNYIYRVTPSTYQVGEKFHLYMEETRYSGGNICYTLEVKESKSSYGIKQEKYMEDISLNKIEEIFKNDFYYLLEISQFRSIPIEIEDLYNLLSNALKGRKIIIQE